MKYKEQIIIGIVIGIIVLFLGQVSWKFFKNYSAYADRLNALEYQLQSIKYLRDDINALENKIDRELIVLWECDGGRISNGITISDLESGKCREITLQK